MEVLDKELKPTDTEHRFSFPTRSLPYVDVAGEFSADLREDHRLGSQFRIEAKRRIILFGREAWGDLPRAN
uniref:Uncharacterized protein n=1 Tax=Salix viminalis TaxID=40686 RepID=A0A6N2MPV3_SALVM